MAFRLIEAEGVVEFDTLKELMDYKAAKLNLAPAQDTVQEKKVVILKEKPSVQKNTKHKRPHTKEEIEAVRKALNKYSHVGVKQVKAVSKLLGIDLHRTHAIYYSKIFNREYTEEKDTPLSEEELDKKIAALPRYESGKLVPNAVDKLAKEIRMPWRKILKYTEIHKIASATSPDQLKTERRKFLWSRMKTLAQMFPGESTLRLYHRANSDYYGGLGKASENGSGKPQQKFGTEDLVFPSIYPLSEEGVRIFEQMMVDLIARKHSRIDYYIISNNVALAEGHEWDYTTWELFCNQVLLNATKIAKVLVGCDSAKIKLERNGRNLSIVYC